MLAGLFLPVLLLASGGALSSLAGSIDETLELELTGADPPLPGHGSARWLERELAFDGTLHVWAEAAFDSFLCVESTDGLLAREDDDSGGKPTPYLALEARRGQRLRIAVAAAREGEHGALRLRLVASPESELTRAAGSRAAEVLAQTRALRAAAQAEEARALLRGVAEELLATAGAAQSRIVGEALFRIAAASFERGDLATARRATEGALAHSERSLPPDHPFLLENRTGLAAVLGTAGDLYGARALQASVLAGMERTLPADDQALLSARSNLAVTLELLGEHARARELYAQVLAGLERKLPADHSALLRVRLNLASTLMQLGELRDARALQESVLAVRERSSTEDDPGLAAARLALATTLKLAGELSAARALQEQVLATYERRLPADHPEVLVARHNLSGTLLAQGELQAALALERGVLEVRERTLPSDHPSLLLARESLGSMLLSAGDLRGARALHEQVLAARERSLPAGHPQLVRSRRALGATLMVLQDLQGARALLESALADSERSFPEEHPDLQATRANLAIVLRSLGDLPGARALQERYLAFQQRTLSADHPLVLAGKLSLANTLSLLRDREGARHLMEEVLAVRERTLEAEHPELLAARSNLAAVLKHVGQAERARALEESVLTVRERDLTPEHPALLNSRQNLAVTLKLLGEPEAARGLEESVLAARERSLPADHPELLGARRNLAVTLAMLGDLAGARSLLPALLAGIERRALAAVLLSPREALETLEAEASRLAIALELGEHGEPALRERLFEVVETRRVAASTPPYLGRLSTLDEELVVLSREAAAARGALNDLVAGGALSAVEDEARRDELERHVALRDEAERELRRALAERGFRARSISAQALAAALPQGCAAIGFLRLPRPRFEVSSEELETSEEHQLAHVLRHDGTLERVALGPASELERAVEAWRAALGRSLSARGHPLGDSEPAPSDELEAGRELRARLLDPLLAAAGGGVTSLVVCADDLVFLVPLDALPEHVGGEGRLGDRVRIALVPSFGALLQPTREVRDEARFVALGAIDYSTLPGDEPPLLALASAPIEASLRSGEGGFEPLPQTERELATLARLFVSAFEREPTLLSGAAASKAELARAASGARFLHVATHGWFAPETAAAIQPSDEEAEGPRRMELGEVIVGFAPQTLCGLALAGANRGRDALGRVPGLLTAEELCALDLSSCELAVLSACETNVGIRRAGQGIQSLQAALHAAGARTAITSLWKVDDEATRELMERFYTYLWQEERPKAEALWRAKQELRAAGRPVRDWAGWVLSGDPD